MYIKQFFGTETCSDRIYYLDPFIGLVMVNIHRLVFPNRPIYGNYGVQEVMKFRAGLQIGGSTTTILSQYRLQVIIFTHIGARNTSQPCEVSYSKAAVHILCVIHRFIQFLCDYHSECAAD